MLKITDPQDLLKYLETRKEIVEKLTKVPITSKAGYYEQRLGIKMSEAQVYAFEESIRAVKAMIECMSQPQLGVYNGDAEE